MQLINLTVTPKTTFDLPFSEGYQLYSAILAIIKESNPKISADIHNSQLPSLSISGLAGPYDKSEKKGHKKIKTSFFYNWRIGISDPNDEVIFQNIISPILEKDKEIPLQEGLLSVQNMETSSETFDGIFKKIQRYHSSDITFHFFTPTCIKYKNSNVTELFPHRIAVFYSLLSKYNRVCPEKIRLSIDRDELGRFLIEYPDSMSYKTHSVLTNTIFDTKKQHARPIFRQGFTGICKYGFTPDAPESFKNACYILAHFAEYCGVGLSVSRGCGQIRLKIQEDNNAR